METHKDKVENGVLEILQKLRRINELINSEKMEESEAKEEMVVIAG